MNEHLRDLCPHFVSRIVSDVDVFGEQKLADAERAVIVGENVDGLNGRCNVYLNWQASCRIPCSGRNVQCEHSARENGWELGVQIQCIGHGVILSVIFTQFDAGR